MMPFRVFHKTEISWFNEKKSFVVLNFDGAEGKYHMASIDDYGELRTATVDDLMENYTFSNIEYMQVGR